MLCFVFAVLIVLLDQFIKRWIILTLPLFDKMELLPGVVGITHVRNTGAAFSILTDQRWLLIIIAGIAALLLIAILLRYDEGFWGTLGLAAVLGGTIGNLVDRISYGYVIDIFEFQFFDFAIFNVADIFITLGGITFLIYFIATTIKPPKSSPLAAGNAAAEHVQLGRPQVDAEIGGYDFEYGDDPVGGAGGYESIAEGVPDSFIDYSESEAQEPVDYPEPVSMYELDSDVPSSELADMAAALNALGNLEQELQEAGLLDDGDLDDMLREYGFEEDTD